MKDVVWSSTINGCTISISRVLDYKSVIDPDYKYELTYQIGGNGLTPQESARLAEVTRVWKLLRCGSHSAYDDVELCKELLSGR